MPRTRRDVAPEPHCSICDYPLRNLPRRGRCPECGEPYDIDSPHPESPQQQASRRRLRRIEPWLMLIFLVIFLVFVLLWSIIFL